MPGSPQAVAKDRAEASRRTLEPQLEEHRRALTGYCYRMLGSPFEAEDAVQETFLRAWRGLDRFEGRCALRSWLYRIATNVCLDMLGGRSRRARLMDLGGAGEPEGANLNALSEATWIEPVPDRMIAGEDDPAEAALARETVALAFVAALQHLPARQRAALILCEVLHWKASEAAELLEMSVAAVNSALQRARATLEAASLDAAEMRPEAAKAGARREGEGELLGRYVDAFERYDIDALTALIREDAIQSMPPFDLWLQGREDIFAWWLGPGIGCRGSRLLPAPRANGCVAYGQYKPSESGEGYEPWALQVLDIGGGGLRELTFFLDTARLFPLFGLPLEYPGDHASG
jgi:RNA polymerase sigma-70 factor (ECF subfamily)